jgi:MYXO-CTERM domain-containing protein
MSQDTPHCDPLMNLTFVHELGLATGGFPTNEEIDAFANVIPQAACPSHDNPNQPNVAIRMVNLSGIPWVDVHYVADPGLAGAPGTIISNEDGLVNAGQAFRIDNVGVNQPLINESINANLIFEPGEFCEFWTFIIDDYVNTGGIPANAFTSIGVGNGSFGPPSSGSIIAIAVPEPSSLAVAAMLGMAPLLRRRRR